MAADSPVGERTPARNKGRGSGRAAGSETPAASPAASAVAWAMAHLSEREAVFARADLLAATLAHAPGAVSIAEAEREVAALEKAGTLHAFDLPGAEDSLATAKTVAEERETVASMRTGQGRGSAPMRGWQVQGHLNKGPLTAGQKDAVKLILSAKDRVVGVQGFHRPYKRIGVEKGDERRVVGVDHKSNGVLLDDGKGGKVAWKPAEIGGRRGGSEVYRAEGIELRAGDRIRWTRNDAGLGLVNSRTAEVLSVANGRVAFRLEDGKALQLGAGDPQLRHLDHAWASTVHAFQGRTVDNVIAAMEARHPHLTTQKSFYVEISRARDRAELVTDDAAELRAQLQAVTGERIAALEGIGEMKREEPGKAAEAARSPGTGVERGAGEGIGKDRGGAKAPAKELEPPVRGRGKGGMDLGL